MRVLVGLVGAAFIAFGVDGAGAQTGSVRCLSPHDWHTKADAEHDRLYVNETNGVYLFEYTPEGAGERLQGNPFWLSMPVQIGALYELRTNIRTGNGTRFLVKVDGAVDATSGSPIQFSLKGTRSRALRQRIKATGPFVEVYIRGEHFIKFWSFVGPTSLCPIG